MTSPQRSLLDQLEPIDPYDLTDRIPGIDAPCICHTGYPATCGWPYCLWPSHQPRPVVETEEP